MWLLGKAKVTEQTGAFKRSTAHFLRLAAFPDGILHIHSSFLRFAGAMRSASRYFATVRRAHSMPCSFSMSDTWLSDSGFFGVSAATNCLISARTAVLDALPPVSVPSAEPKKYFSSK